MTTINLSIAGDKSKAAGYHNINSGIQTFEFSFSEWAGLLEIQATLALDPNENDWFRLNLTDPANSHNNIVFDRDSTAHNSLIYANCLGNFIWIRAKITTDSGTVNYIRYNY
jgi:hypothetical protein